MIFSFIVFRLFAEFDRFGWTLLALIGWLFSVAPRLRADERYSGASAGGPSRLVTRSNV
jgi:hypothetical protein